MFKKLRTPTAATFEPSTEIFPPIDVSRIAKSLNLVREARSDGSGDLPPTTAGNLCSTELSAVNEISRRRKRGLDDHHRHFNAYQGRVDARIGAVEVIEQIAGKLCNEMISMSKSQRNLVKIALRGVQDRNIGEQNFKAKHKIVGPPRDKKSAALMIFGLLFAVLVEVTLAGTFFAEKNTSGLLGGLSTALMLTTINVVFCLLCGLGSRFINLAGVANKLLGCICMLGFLLMAVGFNFLVAHFRDALDSLPWEQAAGVAFQSLRENPLGIESFDAVVISLFGFLASLIGFIEGRIWLDPHPGYNVIYSDVDTAFEDYADAFEEAHAELDALYESHKDELNGESARLRGIISDAASAHLNQLRLTENFAEFCVSCDQAVDALLNIYREENGKVRSTQVPSYFNEPHKLNTIQLANESQVSKKQIEAQLNQVDKVAHENIQKILTARRDELAALPTTEEVLDELHRENARKFEKSNSDLTDSGGIV